MEAGGHFYVGIPGVDAPVYPGVALQNRNMFEARVQVQAQDQTHGVVLIDDSRLINRIVSSLKTGFKENYSSLMKYGINKRFLDSGKISEDQMRYSLMIFSAYLLKQCCVHAEFVDLTPEKRGHKLEEGKNAVLYRGDVRVSGETLEVSRAEVVQVVLPYIDQKEDLFGVPITEDWIKITGASKDSWHNFGDDNYFGVNNGYDILKNLIWDFRDSKRPFLHSIGNPYDRVPDVGSLLGSRLSEDDIIKSFESDAPQVSEHQLEIRRLEKELVELTGKSAAVKERLARLRETKPK